MCKVATRNNFTLRSSHRFVIIYKVVAVRYLAASDIGKPACFACSLKIQTFPPNHNNRDIFSNVRAQVARFTSDLLLRMCWSEDHRTHDGTKGHQRYRLWTLVTQRDIRNCRDETVICIVRAYIIRRLQIHGRVSV